MRRELAGPSLVALPSAADSARLAVGAVQIPSAIVPQPSGAFGLWIPNPAWTRREDLPAGQVALLCQLHGASVALSRLDHLEPGASLDTAAEAVANWIGLIPELRLGPSIPLAVRERQAVHRVAEGRRGGVPFRVTLDVIPQREHYLVLVCMAPAAASGRTAPAVRVRAALGRTRGPVAGPSAAGAFGREGPADRPCGRGAATSGRGAVAIAGTRGRDRVRTGPRLSPRPARFASPTERARTCTRPSRPIARPTRLSRAMDARSCTWGRSSHGPAERQTAAESGGAADARRNTPGVCVRADSRGDDSPGGVQERVVPDVLPILVGGGQFFQRVQVPLQHSKGHLCPVILHSGQPRELLVRFPQFLQRFFARHFLPLSVSWF